MSFVSEFIGMSESGLHLRRDPDWVKASFEHILTCNGDSCIRFIFLNILSLTFSPHHRCRNRRKCHVDAAQYLCEKIVWRKDLSIGKCDRHHIVLPFNESTGFAAHLPSRTVIESQRQIVIVRQLIFLDGSDQREFQILIGHFFKANRAVWHRVCPR